MEIRLGKSAKFDGAGVYTVTHSLSWARYVTSGLYCVAYSIK